MNAVIVRFSSITCAAGSLTATAPMFSKVRDVVSAEGPISGSHDTSQPYHDSLISPERCVHIILPGPAGCHCGVCGNFVCVPVHNRAGLACVQQDKPCTTVSRK